MFTRRNARVYVGADGKVLGGPLHGTRHLAVLIGGLRSNVIVGTSGPI